MAIEINIPDIGADEVEVTEVLVKVGDKIEAEQSLITVEGDKASMEVPSPQAGVVKELKVAVGDKVTIGKLIMIFEENDGGDEKPVVIPEQAGITIQSKEINVPDIGSDEMEVTEVLVKVGDKVKAAQSLITVEGDKVLMEVPAPFAGTVKELTVNIGDKVNTGSFIMVFEVAVGGSDAASAEGKMSQTQQKSPNQSGCNQNVKLPDVGDDEVEVTDIIVKVGDKISVEQPLITVEGENISMEVPAPFAGTVKEIKINIGDKISSGSHIIVFEVEDGNSVAAVDKDYNKSKGEFAENNPYVHATPIVRRLAREFGVNLEKIKGTGRKGRILREDIQVYVKEAVKHAEAASAPAGGCILPKVLLWPKVDFSKFGATEEVELGRIQKISGANLHRNWIMITHVTQFDKADITEAEEFRKQQNTEAKKKNLDVKITQLVFIMKTVGKALEEFPRFNGSLSEDAQKLTLKKYINIGVAIDTPNGLVVPVFCDVNKKGIVELSYELTEISKKARVGKLKLSDMQGGCFTISSLGNIGGTAFTPIINAPEVAILGVSKSSITPVWNGKEFMPRLMLPLSLSYDHRVIDGADGARFIGFINNLMSDIRRLVM